MSKGNFVGVGKVRCPPTRRRWLEGLRSRGGFNGSAHAADPPFLIKTGLKRTPGAWLLPHKVWAHHLFSRPRSCPKNLLDPQEIPRKITFLFLGRVANNKSGLVGSRFTGVAFTSESISSPSFLRTPKTVRNLP